MAWLTDPVRREEEWRRLVEAGMSRVLHLLGYRDTATARWLTEEASSRADFRVSGVRAHFTGPDDTDLSAGNAG
jgi:hypothetical protein